MWELETMLPVIIVTESGFKLSKDVRIYYHCFMIDVDECSADSGQCDVNADCTNSAGAYSCSCKQGFTGNGTTCEGMQECLLTPYTSSSSSILI